MRRWNLSYELPIQIVGLIGTGPGTAIRRCSETSKVKALRFGQIPDISRGRRGWLWRGWRRRSKSPVFAIMLALLHRLSQFFAPVGASSTDDLKDFKRAVALQASPDQVVRFRRLTESKANSDVTKRSKTVTSDLERSRIARQQIYGVAERLDKALNDVQARQLAIGSKMGIQSEGSSQ
jgi:hypothetical protein